MNLHRLRPASTPAALALALTWGLIGFTPPARAALLTPGTGQSFPDIATDTNGALTYNYDPGAGVGTLDVTNAPSMLAFGPQPSDEAYVYDNGTQTRQQLLQLKLNSSGQIMTGDGGNTFTMYGSVTVNGHTYSGLLLQGTPVAFGWQTPPSTPDGTSAFDVDVKLTGGALQQAYGPDAYIRVTPEIGSTFTGSFGVDFQGQNAWTSVQATNPPSPSPIPEPSMFAILLVCGGAAAAYRHRRRV